MKPVLVCLSTVLLIACGSLDAPNNVEQEQVTEAEAPEDLSFISLEEFCAENPCRENRQVYFLTDGQPIDEVLPLYWPIVQGDRLSLLPGDKVYIEAEVVDGLFTDFKLVETVTDDEKTISLDFSQMEDKPDMMLVVKNPFSDAMKFHLDMIDFGGASHPTSSCVVMPGVSSYEHWPHAIPELIVSNIRAVEFDGTFACEY